jgi:hypothetical protein
MGGGVEVSYQASDRGDNSKRPDQTKMDETTRLSKRGQTSRGAGGQTVDQSDSISRVGEEAKNKGLV